jgi:hypothetical protein
MTDKAYSDKVHVTLTQGRALARSVQERYLQEKSQRAKHYLQL